MKKLLIPVLLSSLLLADCTLEKEKQAIKVWQKSIHHENNLEKKIELLFKADALCPLEVVSVDLAILQAEADKHTKNALTQDALEALNTQNSTLTNVPQAHIDNNAQKINKLLGISYDNTLKSLTTIGGSYKADLNFDQGSYEIRDNALLNDILATIDEILSSDKNALFVFEGGASSEGNAEKNDLLAMNRAKALKEKISSQYKSNIKVFSNGERQLVCKGGFLPEENSQGEFKCITTEDKIASRRVSIRRER